MPNSAIRNLIREDKVHQIYGMMQTGQAKYGMQTFNQSLAALYFKRMITLQTALARSSLPRRAAGDHQPRSRRAQPERSGPGARRPRRQGARPMPSFVWKGKTRAGSVQEGVLLADTRDAAEAVAAAAEDPGHLACARRAGRSRSCPSCRPASAAKRIAIFTRQFSVMLDAGLPLVQCLEILGEQEENKNFRAIIQQVRTDVESGASLADAMRKHPKAFDDLFVNMIAAGEAGGILDIILQRLSTYIEKAVKLKSQVKSALIYPVAVIVIAAGVVYIILWKVIPVFAQLFAGLGGEMPFLTRMVIGASQLRRPLLRSSSSPVVVA